MNTPHPEKMTVIRRLGGMHFSVLCAMMTILLSAAVPQAAAVDWVGTGANAYWGNTANWTGGVPAGGIGSTVRVMTSSGFYNSGNLMLADASGVDTPFTVGTYIYGNTGGGSYTFSLKNVTGGTASLTFDVAAGNAVLRFTQQFASSTQQINTLVVLNDSLNITAQNTGGNNYINGAISSGVGGTGLSIDGTNGNVGVALGGVNTYTGGTNISATYGKLKLITGNDRLPTATILTVNGGATSGGNFNLNTFSQKVGGLAAGSGTVQGTISNDGAGTGTATLTVDSTTVDSTFDGIIRDGATAKVALTKAGAGTTLTLTGANTYTGATSITGGNLVVNGSLALGSAVTVGASGTLSGSGIVGGSLAVAGTLSPGNSPGTLSTGTQTWFDGGNYNWQLLDTATGAGAGYDTMAIVGGLDLANLTGGTDFNINLWTLSSIGPDVNGDAANFNPASNYSWTIVSTTTGVTGFNAANFTINPTANNGTAGFSNTFDGAFSVGVSGNNLVLNYTAVPEPATWGLLAFSLTTVLVLRRRKS